MSILATIETTSRQAPAARGWRVGVDPIARVHRMQNHDEALRIWQEAGAVQRILVHLDAHPDAEWAGDFVNIANFICPALQRGMIKTLYWVIPDPSWCDPRARRALSVYLRELVGRYPGPRAPVRLHNDEIRTSLLGIPVHVRPLASLPQCSEPVLLDIDVDFLLIAHIPDAANIPPPERPWCWPATLIQRLRERRVATDLATIAYSTEGGYTPLRWKYLGDEVADRLQHPDDGRDGPSSRWMRQRRATLALAEGRCSEAAEAFQRLLAEHPHAASVCFGFAEACAEQGLSEAAKAQYRQAIAHDPSYETTADGTGFGYLQCGDVAQAERAFRRALALNPSDAYAYYGLGKVAARRREWPSALAHLHQALALQPNFLDAHRALAKVSVRLGRLEEAIAAYERALALGLSRAATLNETFIATERSVPHRVSLSHFSLYAELAPLYARAGRVEEAINNYRFWLAVGRNGTPGTHLRLARLYARQHKWGMALRAVGDAIAGLGTR